MTLCLKRVDSAVWEIMLKMAFVTFLPDLVSCACVEYTTSLLIVSRYHKGSISLSSPNKYVLPSTVTSFYVSLARVTGKQLARKFLQKKKWVLLELPHRHSRSRIKTEDYNLSNFATQSINVFHFFFLQPFLTKYTKTHDTCGVNNLHGMPGILGAIAGAIAAAHATLEKYGSQG